MIRIPPRYLLALFVGLAPLSPIGPADAQPKPDADWPCAQRKVSIIAPGTVWSGPDLAEAGSWKQDNAAAALAQKLASRRTSLEEADALIDAFAREAGADKDRRLMRVFAGVLDVVNAERERILAGIERYARGQRQLAERVREEADRISAAKDAPDAPTPADLQEVENRFRWDKRIFEERSQALTAVCETPVLLEQRVFEIGRRIEARL